MTEEEGEEEYKKVEERDYARKCVASMRKEKYGIVVTSSNPAWKKKMQQEN